MRSMADTLIVADTALPSPGQSGNSQVCSNTKNMSYWETSGESSVGFSDAEINI